MRKCYPLLGFIMLFSAIAFATAESHELTMSLDDKYVVADTDKWSVEVVKTLPLRFAEVGVTPKKGYDFSLMLYFKCDTPDLAQFDSPRKIKRSIRVSSEPYLSNTVEKELKIKELNPKGWYGCYVVLTDKSLAAKRKIPKGEFKYITRGMVRLSPDSALGFSLMTNDVDSDGYKDMLRYICNFAKEKK